MLSFAISNEKKFKFDDSVPKLRVAAKDVKMRNQMNNETES